jgi:hypothetical protein
VTHPGSMSELRMSTLRLGALSLTRRLSAPPALVVMPLVPARFFKIDSFMTESGCRSIGVVSASELSVREFARFLLPSVETMSGGKAGFT